VREDDKTGFAARLKTAASAKAALLAKFKPTAAAPDANFQSRADRRALDHAEAKKSRADAKAEKAAAKQAVTIVAEQAAAAAEAAALDGVRGERKERKALSKADAKAKRDARYAARQTRRR